MQRTRMVRLATVGSTFHARVIAARLGSEGIVTDLRGNVDGMYPTLGDVHVFVSEEDLAAAQELLMADEVESAFDDDSDADSGASPAPWILVAAVVVAVAIIFARSV